MCVWFTRGAVAMANEGNDLSSLCCWLTNYVICKSVTSRSQHLSSLVTLHSQDIFSLRLFWRRKKKTLFRFGQRPYQMYRHASAHFFLHWNGNYNIHLAKALFQKFLFRAHHIKFYVILQYRILSSAIPDISVQRALLQQPHFLLPTLL